MSIKISASFFSLFPPLIYIAFQAAFPLAMSLTRLAVRELHLDLPPWQIPSRCVIERHPTPQCDTYSSTVSRSPITAFSTDPSFSSHLLLSFIFTIELLEYGNVRLLPLF